MHVASYLLVETFRRHAIELGQVSIENDFLAAKEEDSGIYAFRQGYGCFAHEASIL